MGGQKIENSQKYNMVCDVDCPAASVGYPWRNYSFFGWLNSMESRDVACRI